MKLYAKLIKISKNIEEEVIVSFGEMELLCFSSYSPIKLIEGSIYFIELNLYFIDNINIENSREKKIGIKRIENDFKHIITGFLYKNQLITKGLYFYDDYFLAECPYFENEILDIFVDRIDVSFLSA